MTVTAFVVAPGDGDRIPGPAGGPSTIKARTATTGGSFALIENVIGPGMGPPRHAHRREDEMWWVLDGEFRFIADDAILAAPAGSFVFVPRGTAHCFQNVGEGPARILVMFTPSGMERFFEEHARLGAEAADPARYAEVAERQWMEVVGPPLAMSHPDETHTAS